MIKATQRFSHTDSPFFFFFSFLSHQMTTSPTCVLSGGHQAPTQQPWNCPCTPTPSQASLNVLTEKILTVLASSSSQMNFALRLVRRSSSRGGGFTNTTYGMNSSEYTRFIFCRAEEEGGGRGGAMTFTEAKNRSAKNVANLDQSRFWEV